MVYYILYRSEVSLRLRLAEHCAAPMALRTYKAFWGGFRGLQ